MQKISSNTFTPPHPLKTAVLFIVFNRPDITKQVFEAIRKAKPPCCVMSKQIAPFMIALANGKK